MPSTESKPEHLPQGALLEPEGDVVWRLWAPGAERVVLVTWPGGARTETPMTPGDDGYHVHRLSGVEEGLRYAYKLPDGGEYPDPASRWQPDGVHRPSAVFFPSRHRWNDDGWTGVARDDLVIYELHVGTFTPEGTLDAIAPRLESLRELGVTAIELMPLAQFPGERNWGYDGVHPFAVQQSYGGPRALRRLVDAAHRAGVAVLLDVVYNHVGPEGNYLEKFGPYFTDRYHTPWGKALNVDGPQSDAVRRLLADNARMWVRDFHVDGLRLDAVQTIFDFGARHVLAEIQEEVQREARRAGRRVHVIAETNQNDPRLVRSPARGGYGLDGVWSDDFHHAVHALLCGEREGYYLDFGRPEHLAKALSKVFVYDGCHSPFRRRRHGAPVGNLDRSMFVVCTQNHDQVGNRARGDRSSTRLPWEAQRLAAGLLMLCPCTPMLFMGQEYAETRPFPFFCSFGDASLIEAVRRGRRKEFAALKFRWGGEIPDPHDPATFESAKLSWQWPEGTPHAGMRRLYGDLLAARRAWPALRDRKRTAARRLPARGRAKPRAGMEDAEGAEGAVLRIERGGRERLIALVNLGPIAQPLPLPGPHDDSLDLLLSTEAERYGGSRRAGEPPEELLPYEMLIYGNAEWRSRWLT